MGRKVVSIMNKGRQFGRRQNFSEICILSFKVMEMELWILQFNVIRMFIMLRVLFVYLAGTGLNVRLIMCMNAFVGICLWCQQALKNQLRAT